MSIVATLLLVVPLAAAAQEPAAPASPAPAAAPADAAAPKSDLVAQLTDELRITPKQAEGTAGALFGLAKTRLKPEDFAKVAASVPNIDGLLKAAPAPDAKQAAALAIAGKSSLGGLASLAPSFAKLGLSPELALKAVPILTKFVGGKGGAEVAALLAGVLK
jgi:uncharacterized protein VcgC/VcgE DUF2780